MLSGSGSKRLEADEVAVCVPELLQGAADSQAAANKGEKQDFSNCFGGVTNTGLPPLIPSSHRQQEGQAGLLWWPTHLSKDSWSRSAT